MKPCGRGLLMGVGLMAALLVGCLPVGEESQDSMGDGSSGLWALGSGPEAPGAPGPGTPLPASQVPDRDTGDRPHEPAAPPTESQAPDLGTGDRPQEPAAPPTQSRLPHRSNGDRLRGPSASASGEDPAYWERSRGLPAVPVDDPALVSEGQMRVAVAEGQLVALPLAHTSVEAETTGFLSRVYVTQYFTNPLDHPIEAVYVFPLPPHAAVDDMEMLIGDRLIRGIMKKREEARRVYEEAKARGQTASLLEEERPNVFTQSVANILPGDRIRVRIGYVEDLKHDEGTYEFVFPMVVGPRYIPGEPAGKQAGGWSPDTVQVPDASRITPPVLKPGERTGHDIDVTLTINQGVELGAIVSPSHDILVARLGKGRAKVTLREHDSLPNKDLVVRFRTPGVELDAAPLFHREGEEGYFMLVLQPEDEPKPDVISPRELVFVVDCSGSMDGEPITKSKDAMRKVLKGMGPDDRFQIVTFSEWAEYFRAAPVQNTPENLKAGLEHIDRIAAAGGTEMMQGIRAALDYPSSPGRVRIVALMTDGFIGNEHAILSAVKEKLGDSRLFSFGIGSSVNRYLLDGLAQMGRGYATYVRQDESADAAVARFYRRISAPTLVDIRVEVMGGVTLEDVTPGKIPDLFAGQPLTVHGRYKGAGSATLVVTGRRGNAEFRREIPVVFPVEEKGNGALATLWARTRIDELSAQMYRRDETAELVEPIIELAIRHRIMSKYTAFVAVEETVRVVDGRLETVQVSVPMPEGTSYRGVFGPVRDRFQSPAPVSSSTVIGLVGAGGGGAGIGSLALGSLGGPDVDPFDLSAIQGGGWGAGGAPGQDLHELDKKKVSRALMASPAVSKVAAKVRIIVGDPSGGEVDMERVRQYVRKQTATVRWCVEKERRKTPNLNGIVELEVTLDPSGAVSVKVLENKVGSKPLADCLVERVSRWVLPAPADKPVKLTLKIELSPESL